MESAIITFKDKENNKKWVEISLNYDKETSDLDYNVKLSDIYSANNEMDFVGFLTDMFLKSLQLNTED